MQHMPKGTMEGKTLMSKKTFERRAFIVSTTALVTTATSCGDDTNGGSAPQLDAGGADADVATSDATSVPTSSPTAVETGGASTRPDDTSRPGVNDPDASAEGGGSKDGGSEHGGSEHGGSLEAGAQDDSTAEPNSDDTSTRANSTSADSSTSAPTSVETESRSSDVEGSSATSETLTSTGGDATSSADAGALDGSYDGGGTSGNTSDETGPGVLCTTTTSNGDHSHPLTIPVSDLTSFDDVVYILEDGGTGHTHQLMLTAYDIVSLLSGYPFIFPSTEVDGHYHICEITCPQ